MATIARPPNLSTPRSSDPLSKAPTLKPLRLNRPWGRSAQVVKVRMRVGPLYVSPDQIAEKVAESIKNAEMACSDDPASGECVAAWDEVEELSAAASHARDRQKTYDPLETFCKDNPETEECRTYED